MCIILKVDLRCCNNCREKVRKYLKRIAGVELVEVGDDEATVMVCGKGFDEAEILRQVKKVKSRSEVKVVSRIVHNVADPLHDIDAGGRSAPKPELKLEISEPEPELEPKPKPKPKTQEKHRSNKPRKVDTLVTERTLEESQGIKIRTRVLTTSEDGIVSTCIRVEENRFIINKYCHSARNHSPDPMDRI